MKPLKKFEQFVNEDVLKEAPASVQMKYNNYTELEQKAVAKRILSKDNSFSPYEAEQWAKNYDFLKQEYGEDYDSVADEIIKDRNKEREEKMKNPILLKVVDGINSGKLKILRGGEKMYGNIKLSITELVWARNFEDGFDIDVYDGKFGSHVGSISLTASTDWKPKITEAF